MLYLHGYIRMKQDKHICTLLLFLFVLIRKKELKRYQLRKCLPVMN